MATITGFTAARAKAIEDKAIVDGNVVGDNLILVAHDGTTIDAGSVRGATGPIGPTGPAGPSYTPIGNRARMQKSTVGYNAAGSNNAANTWHQLSGFTQNYAVNFAGINPTAGTFTIPVDGYYDIFLQMRWWSRSSATNAALCFVKGALTPTDAWNSDPQLILGITSEESEGWLIQQISAPGTKLDAGDVIALWARSGASGQMNQSNSAIPGRSYAQIQRVQA